MKTRNEIIEAHKIEYHKSTKKEKTRIITIVSEATGLSRDRTKKCLKKPLVSKIKKLIKPKETRGRKATYDSTLIYQLEKLWKLADFACGKRLKQAIPNLIDALQRHGELTIDEETKQKLCDMSPATIDRLLKKSKERLSYKGISTTKPGTLLKSQIAIRSGSDWDDAVPGYVEIDLVAHCGETTAGSYLNTLDVTDICTGWTETIAVINKSENHVFNGLMNIEKQAPYEYKGIDSDNGGEFINYHLYKYCLTNNICFTRGRPYKKNDGAHVEQKNWQIVRRNIGYERYEGLHALELMNKYYSLLRLHTNFFLPQSKLINKNRVGSKIVKKYEPPTTPYQRMIDSKHISDEIKEKLKEQYYTINPAHINRQMDILLKELQKLAIAPKVKYEEKTSKKGFALMLSEKEA